MPPRYGHGDAGPPPGWEDVAQSLPEGVDRSPTDRTTAWDRCLALTAVGVPNHAHGRGRRWRVYVPAENLERAGAEIAALSGENRAIRPGPPLPAPRVRGDVWTVILVMGLLAAFHVATRRAWPGLGLSPADWEAVGAADSAAMLAGQWWRAATALTLHADVGHLAGNLAIGGAFLILLGRQLGSGTAMAMAVAAGALGNAANALLHGPGHLSVGASTAVFGAVGVLAALRAVMERRLDPRRTLIPVAAGLGLLSMLGTAGEHTDLWAHALGFIAGLALGAPLGLLALRRGLPGPPTNILTGLAAAAVLAWAWLEAFTA